MTTATAAKSYTINDVMQEEAHIGIYVRNNAPLNPISKTRNRVLVSVPKDGVPGTDNVIVPSVNIPINLTHQVSRTSLLRSSEFRRAIQIGVLALVTPDDAEKILSTADAQDTLRMLRDEEGMEYNDVQAGVIAATGDENTANRQSANLNTTGVSQTVFSVMEGAVNDSEDTVIVSLQRIEEKSKKDYEFILARATALGFTKLASKVSRKLENMQAREGSDDV